MLPSHEPAVHSSFRGARTPIASSPAGVSAARRRAHAWDVASLIVNCLLLALGIATVYVSSKYLGGTTSSNGKLLGWFCMSLAILGWVCAGLPLPLLPQTNGQARVARIRTGLALPLRTALLVFLVLGGLGTMSLLNQVSSDVGTHCIMAEAAVRIAHLEETVTRIRHDELLSQVFFRLNELDDLIHEASEGHTTRVDLRTQAFQLQDQDRDLIRERVDRLARHSASLLTETRKQLEGARREREDAKKNLTEAVSQGPAPARTFAELEANHRRLEQLEADRKHKEEMVRFLEQRAEAVEQVLHYIESRSHDAHAALSFEEYQMVLDALLQGTAPPSSPEATPGDKAQAGAQNIHISGDKSLTQEPGSFNAYGQQQTATDSFHLVPPPIAALRDALSRDQENIHATKAAFDRRASNAYEAQLAQTAHIPKQIAEKREAARREFESRFASVYQAGGTGHFHPDAFRDSLITALDALPEHCLRDEVAFSWLRWLAYGLGVVLAAAGYTTATSLASKYLNAVKQL